MSVILGAATLYGLLVFALIACVLMAFGVAWLVERWRAGAVVPRGPARPTTNQRDFGDEDDAATDIATEGVGTHTRYVPVWWWARRPDGRPFVRRAWPSWSTPLAYLPEPEWRLWTGVIAESAR